MLIKITEKCLKRLSGVMKLCHKAQVDMYYSMTTTHKIKPRDILLSNHVVATMNLINMLDLEGFDRTQVLDVLDEAKECAVNIVDSAYDEKNTCEA